MDLEKLKLKVKFFNALKGLSKQDKILYLKTCPNEAIETMCEACFNLLKHEKLKNKKKLLSKIKPIQSAIKKLSNKSSSLSNKRSLFDDSKVVCGVTSAIGENILPLLNSLVRTKECYSKNSKKQVKKKKPKKKK